MPEDIQSLDRYIYTDPSIEGAEDLFIEAKDILLDVTNWQNFSYMPGVNFTLIDFHGKKVKRWAHKGDYIKIEKNIAQQWLHIEAVLYDDYPDENKECFSICLRLCDGPGYEIQEHSDAPAINIIIERIYNRLFSFRYINNAQDADNQTNNFIITNEEWNSFLKTIINFI